MNKLVLVGNGFDLAHGLPTSYGNFIKHFWTSLPINFEDNLVKKLVFVNSEFYRFLNYGAIDGLESLMENLKEYCREYGYHYSAQNYLARDKGSAGFKDIFKFENIFFKRINIKNYIENWVDIEEEYYKNIKEIIDKFQDTRRKSEIFRLNKEFEEIKNHFENYLLKNVSEKFDLYEFANGEWAILHNKLKPISVFNNESNLLSEFQIEEDKEDINYLFGEEKKGKEISTDTYVLNFNYTLTVNQYLYSIFNVGYSKKIIHIHGVLNSSKNPINFGFGDEMDDYYKIIEKLNDNEFLRNFKSFKYSQNSNYQNLLRIIESEKFQVYIMGHSCGLSDRTLLNTIFEHNNCRSIKVFFYEWENQEEEKEDNFTEIIQNISRHFNDKKIMRSKIVNKTLCEPMPQNIRFKKKES